MADETKCPHCGKPVPPGAALGLCPECMLKVGAGSQMNAPGPQAGGAAAGRANGFKPPKPEELAPHFPQLEILELLGQGGMGAVYKARQTGLNRLVALKVLPPVPGRDPAFAERFTREAQALARLSHSSIVAVHEFGQAGGFYFFVMEYVDGINLRQMLRAERMSPREAMAIVPQVCDALQYAHDQGIVHRDIKPENVLVDKLGRVKIADFGLAKLLGREAEGESLTRSAEVMGTPQYMAPEQLETPLEVDHRADIYSLGVVFYEMLTGELPLGRFAAPSKKVRLDVRLDEVVLRALEKEPGLRYQQASQLKTQVETIAGGGAKAPDSGAALEGRSPNPGAADPSRAAVEKLVAAPAIGLLIAGILDLLLLLLVPLFLYKAVDSYSIYPAPAWTASIRLVLLPVSSLLFIGLLGLMVILGAMRMMRLRSYGFAVASSVLAMITPPGLLIGLPFGVWALIVLSRREVGEAFESNHARRRTGPGGTEVTGPPRLSRTALAGLTCLLLALVLLPVLALVFAGAAHAAHIGPVFGVGRLAMIPLLLVELLILILSSILGWVAITQIRHSAGRLYGLGVAVFDALLFPLLLLNVMTLALLAVFATIQIRSGFVLRGSWDGYIALIMGLMFLACALPDWLIIRWVWRAARRPLDGSAGPPSSRLAGVLQCALILIATAVITAAAWIIVPNFIPTRIGFRAEPREIPPAVAMAVSSTFGPVIERVVEENAEPNRLWFDFDTGDSLSSTNEFPAGSDPDDELVESWRVRTGMDAAARVDGHRAILMTCDALSVPVAEEQWDWLTPADIQTLLALTQIQGVTALPAEEDRLPATYVFKTREGGMGVLQIRGLSADPRGVKIRYKLVQAGDSANATGNGGVELTPGGIRP